MTARWRFEVRLAEGGRELMRGLMKMQGVTIVELAKRCGSTTHRSTIGHLLSGKRSGCSPELAGKIEDELLKGARGGADLKLFEVRVYRVSRDGASSPDGRPSAAA